MTKSIFEKFSAILQKTRVFLAAKAKEDVDFWEKAWLLEILTTWYLIVILVAAVVNQEWNSVLYWARFLYFSIQELIVLGCVAKILGINLEYNPELSELNTSGKSYFWG